MKSDNTNTGNPFDNISEQIINISKAGAFDIVSEQNIKLQDENWKLRQQVKYLQDLIKEYTGKMLVNLSGGKVDEFLKEQITKPETIDDLPQGLFEQPGNNDLENTIN